MWPRDRGGEVVRIGRLAVERWGASGQTFARIASQPVEVDRSAGPECLAGPLRALLADRPAADVTLLIESTWMPVLLAPIGRAVLSEPQVEVLLRHRLDLLYRDGAEPVSGWQVRVDYRAGDSVALGFGLPSGLERCLRAVGQDLQLRWKALMPALAWGWRHRPLRRSAPAAGWWVWPEQDRQLVARVHRQRIDGLQAGAMTTDDPHAITQGVDAQALRLGIVTRDPIIVATWGPATRALPRGARLSWAPIATGQPAVGTMTA